MEWSFIRDFRYTEAFYLVSFSMLIPAYDPHSVLGIHEIPGGKIIRVFRPGAKEVFVVVKGYPSSMKCIDPKGLFAFEVPETIGALDYQIYHSSGLLAEDPYAFSPTFGEMDAYFFAKGVHYKLYEVLGGRVCEHQGRRGVKFSVWAPGAAGVSLVGDFNLWDDRVSPMRSLGASGIWELFVPGLKEGEKYKFSIETQEGKCLLKSDPMAYFSELRSATASVTFDVDAYKWSDQEWMRKRLEQSANVPINIYEVHLGSWRRGEGFPNYRELAHSLASYVKEMGFTHIEIMPLSEHPLDESWGYQVSGFYSVTSRYGSPSDFQYFIDYMHQQGIGVFVDWVAAHFPMDESALASFDGTALYEHADPRQGLHPHWNTYIFNYGRFEVSNFLIANALFWLDKMHIDGLRVDAVASMIYLDYGREAGQWIPNRYGGHENLEALEFLRHLNAVVHEKFPKTLMIAEESTSFIGVTHTLAWNGLGFDMKWNMGWMNDTLRYFKVDPMFRVYEQRLLTFGQIYAYSERFMLVLSHDEVVHGKASLLSKMPGDDWQKFANLRLLYSYMICHPGKKLLFMGGELGQWSEWSCKRELDWHLLEYPMHKGLQRCIRELNHMYLTHAALWEKDFEGAGFSWVDFSDERNSVISYLRKAEGSILLCVHHFTPVYLEEYTLSLQGVERVKELFSTDREEYGGSGKIARQVTIKRNGEGRGISLTFPLAPLATTIFEVQFGF